MTADLHCPPASQLVPETCRPQPSVHLHCSSAFEVFHLIFGKPTGQHFTTFLEALKALLEELELTEANLYQQPPPPPQVCLVLRPSHALHTFATRLPQFQSTYPG